MARFLMSQSGKYKMGRGKLESVQKSSRQNVPTPSKYVHGLETCEYHMFHSKGTLQM